MMKTRLVLGWWVVIGAVLAMPFLEPACESTSASTTDAGPAATAADAVAGAAADVGGEAATAAGTDGATDAPAASDASIAPAPTWSQIYSTLLTNPTYASNCMGGSCHDPGMQKGIDLSTQQSGYVTLRSHLVPGSPQTSQLAAVLLTGKMPQGRPRMPLSDVELVKAWIAAGAPNN